MASYHSKMCYHREAFVLAGNFLRSPIRETTACCNRAGTPRQMGLVLHKDADVEFFLNHINNLDDIRKSADSLDKRVSDVA